MARTCPGSAPMERHMTDGRDQELSELLQRALSLGTSERSKLVDETRASDPDLGERLATGLAAESTGQDSGLEHDSWAVDSEPDAVNTTPHARPERIARYRVLSVLGEGGMGVVYLAEQDRPRRTVALKVLKPGHFSPAAKARFEWEAELVGRLQHPGIAQIFEAGTEELADGVRRPFFAMERIEGRTITDHADAENLGARARVALMVAVCDGVQHAHGRGIVHRDIKPANILVDRRGQPKVLDFGVAKVTDAGQRSDASEARGEIVGTLTYMAPEQFERGREIDGRADVYALGVVLFKLLSGQTPITRRGRSTAATLIAVRDEPPQRLDEVTPSPPKGLTCICAHALEKDPDDRYDSPAAMAADLRNFLGHFPVSAHERTRSYVFQCFARRHALALSAVAAVFLALSIGVTTTALQWREARAQAVRAERLFTFFVDRVLSAVSPDEGLGGEVSFAEILARAVKDAEREFASTPEDLAVILDDIAHSFRGLDRVDDALDILARTRVLHVQVHGENSREVAINDMEVALLLRRQGDLDGALALARTTLTWASSALGVEDLAVLKCKNDLAVILKDLGEYKEAEKLYREVWPVRERLLGADDGTTLITRGNLAQVMRATGRVREALPHLEAVLEGHQRLQDPKVEAEHHPDTLISMDLLGSAYLEVGRIEEAEALIRESVRGHESLLGLAHDDTLAARYKLAQVLREKGALDEAVTIGRVSLTASIDLNGSEHRSTAYLRYELGRSLWRTGLHEESRAELEQCLAALRVLFPRGHFMIPDAIAELGRLATDAGDLATARDDFSFAIDEATRMLEPGDWHIAILRVELARALASSGDLGQAIELLDLALLDLEEGLGASHPESRSARDLLSAYRARAER
ncbi:MAG: tetratricopeptide (TPR) repeat protein/predicted Ser/Thr protein kinase [Chlamydiales bacterium]|jgi:tetratricopeptide (TPR) repeat protein/predicted Ser/Thr protein kinase